MMKAKALNHFGVPRVFINGKIMGHIEKHKGKDVFEPSQYYLAIDEMTAIIELMNELESDDDR